jgi:hypothetical protein
MGPNLRTGNLSLRAQTPQLFCETLLCDQLQHHGFVNRLLLRHGCALRQEARDNLGTHCTAQRA